MKKKILKSGFAVVIFLKKVSVFEFWRFKIVKGELYCLLQYDDTLGPGYGTGGPWSECAPFRC